MTSTLLSSTQNGETGFESKLLNININNMHSNQKNCKILVNSLEIQILTSKTSLKFGERMLNCKTNSSKYYKTLFQEFERFH